MMFEALHVRDNFSRLLDGLNRLVRVHTDAENIYCTL